MRIGEVIGTLTLNRTHPSLGRAAFRLVTPLSLADLMGQSATAGRDAGRVRRIGCGVGRRVAISEGGEAAQPFLPVDRPVDAYNAAILDSIQLGAPASEPHGDT